MPKRSRLAERQKAFENRTYLSGFRALYSIPKPELKKSGFRIFPQFERLVFGSPLYLCKSIFVIWALFAGHHVFFPNEPFPNVVFPNLQFSRPIL